MPEASTLPGCRVVLAHAFRYCSHWNNMSCACTLRERRVVRVYAMCCSTCKHPESICQKYLLCDKVVLFWHVVQDVMRHPTTCQKLSSSLCVSLSPPSQGADTCELLNGGIYIALGLHVLPPTESVRNRKQQPLNAKPQCLWHTRTSAHGRTDRETKIAPQM